jgi:hypothetical protein
MSAHLAPLFSSHGESAVLRPDRFVHDVLGYGKICTWNQVPLRRGRSRPIAMLSPPATGMPSDIPPIRRGDP